MDAERVAGPAKAVAVVSVANAVRDNALNVASVANSAMPHQLTLSIRIRVAPVPTSQSVGSAVSAVNAKAVVADVAVKAVLTAVQTHRQMRWPQRLQQTQQQLRVQVQTTQRILPPQAQMPKVVLRVEMVAVSAVAAGVSVVNVRSAVDVTKAGASRLRSLISAVPSRLLIQA